jgi:hypothetical protein
MGSEPHGRFGPVGATIAHHVREWRRGVLRGVWHQGNSSSGRDRRTQPGGDPTAADSAAGRVRAVALRGAALVVSTGHRAALPVLHRSCVASTVAVGFSLPQQIAPSLTSSAYWGNCGADAA